jgi:hypothetical protein
MLNNLIRRALRNPAAQEFLDKWILRFNEFNVEDKRTFLRGFDLYLLVRTMGTTGTGMDKEKESRVRDVIVNQILDNLKEVEFCASLEMDKIFKSRLTAHLDLFHEFIDYEFLSKLDQVFKNNLARQEEINKVAKDLIENGT